MFYSLAKNYWPMNLIIQYLILYSHMLFSEFDIVISLETKKLYIKYIVFNSQSQVNCFQFIILEA
jgi:hypothetical protein